MLSPPSIKDFVPKGRVLTTDAVIGVFGVWAHLTFQPRIPQDEVRPNPPIRAATAAGDANLLVTVFRLSLETSPFSLG